VPSAPDGLRRFGHWAIGDVLAVGEALTPTRLGVGAGFVSLLPLLSFNDGAVGDEAPELRTDLSRPALHIADEFGHARMQWVTGGLFLATLATHDTKLQDAAFTSFQSGVYAMLASGAIKGLIGRVRPYEVDSPTTFRPLSGHRSFPSGHTTLAFAIAVPWVVYYPGPVTYGLLGLSAGTAVSRLTTEHHWFTDVVAGAALGTLTGYWLARRHLDGTTPLRVTPVLGPDGGGLSISYTF
jgi:membrane-associated phospholipid phosphatase